MMFLLGVVVALATVAFGSGACPKDHVVTHTVEVIAHPAAEGHITTTTEKTE